MRISKRVLTVAKAVMLTKRAVIGEMNYLWCPVADEARSWKAMSKRAANQLLCVSEEGADSTWEGGSDRS